mmetsp:Transcript_2933/g.9033  ORF Transcript_2933/g.9033 Transcript_2933/m.9033 type:complete len:247 (-) Transcript_2933:163-903(-)
MFKSLRRVADAAVASRAHRAQFVQGLRDVRPRRPLLDEVPQSQMPRRARDHQPRPAHRTGREAALALRVSHDALGAGCARRRATDAAQLRREGRLERRALVRRNCAVHADGAARILRHLVLGGGRSRRPEPIAQARGAGDGQRGAELRSPFDDAPQPLHEPALEPRERRHRFPRERPLEGLAFAEHRFFDRVYVSVEDGRRQAVLDELDAYHCCFAVLCFERGRPATDSLLCPRSCAPHCCLLCCL